MIRFRFPVLTLLLSICLVVSAAAQTTKAPASPRLASKGMASVVEFGQPAKRGRVVFGGLVPYGQVWRTGANQCTEITFKRDAILGDQKIRAGSYALFTIPGEKEWTIIINSEVGQWGAFNYNPDKDMARVMATTEPTEQEVEKFTIVFKKGKNKQEELVLSWDRTQIRIPIKYQ
jgi:Protein of unknown function (DUF2911)